jgi:aspartyl-tRNA(Asn)/glutamyl-tRNA(Gln) amidotransferase subunit C
MSEDINVGHIARLARLELTDTEQAAFRKEIPEILDYIRQLQEVDVEGIEPTAHAADIVNVMRADVVADSQDLDKTMANAPDDVQGDLIKVPVVIGDDGGSA